jgi:hypothetical protein
MVSPLLDIFTQYGGAAAIGIVFGLVCKAFFARQMHNKIREYQSEIVKSHSRILTLESETDHLQKKVKELEYKFTEELVY